jgi:hypothetical protein
MGCGGNTARGVKLTAHLLLVPRIRMCGAITPHPQCIFMEWYLLKHRDNFTFTLKRAVDRVNTLRLRRVLEYKEFCLRFVKTRKILLQAYKVGAKFVLINRGLRFIISII